jgi:hypothetical protein
MGKYKYILQQYIDGKWVDISYMTEGYAQKLSENLKTHGWNTVNMSTREDSHYVIGFMFSINHGPVRIANNPEYEGLFKKGCVEE